MIKVDIDKFPAIAHTLQVKTVPTVYLLHQGQAIDMIQGNVGD
jgi:thioredoxin-like negative regulator of GroEL